MIKSDYMSTFVLTHQQVELASHDCSQPGYPEPMWGPPPITYPERHKRAEDDGSDAMR